jgi:hypothetical protein
MSSQTRMELTDKESDPRTSRLNDLENLKFDESDQNSEELGDSPPESKDFPDLAPSRSMDFPDGADPFACLTDFKVAQEHG